MKKYLLLTLLIPLAFLGCSKKEGNQAESPPNSDSGKSQVSPTSQGKKERKILYWVDSMHPWYKSDKPGKAPDCGMDLTPVYEEESGPETIPFSSKVSEMNTVHLSNEKQQLIGVTTEVVERKMLTREIHAAGRVAFDPDLMLAQNDYLIALKTSGGDLSSMQNNLVRATQMRLRVLGMSEGQILDLKKKGRPQTSLLVPEKGEAVWVFGSIFESDLPWVKVGTPAQVALPGSEETFDSQVESIDPMIDYMTRTGRVRLRIPNSQGNLRADMFVRLTLHAHGEEMLAIPNNAVLDTGTRQMTFVDKGEGRFEPREIKLGKRGSDYSEVLSGVSQGDKVVTNANFLLDSESRLKAAVSGMEGH
jgi:hypothetical protein